MMIDDVQRLQQPPTESTLPGHYGEHIIEMNYYAGDIFRLRFGGYGVPQTWKRILGIHNGYRNGMDLFRKLNRTNRIQFSFIPTMIQHEHLDFRSRAILCLLCFHFP